MKKSKKQIDADYYKRHQEKILKRVADYYRKNKKRISEYKKKWWRERQKGRLT